jgi:hypothetical protein
MGMDIYSSRGIILTVDEFLGVVNGKNKATVVKACKNFHQDLVTECDKGHKPEPEPWRAELADAFNALADLKPTMPLSTIRGIIASVVVIDGEPAKYGDCYVENSDCVLDLFDKILIASGHDLPSIDEVTAWGSSRLNGWEVPKGIACVVLNSEECYVKALSDQGENVKKVFGHCNETEWTEMSC